jgi:hypothetical protein
VLGFSGASNCSTPRERSRQGIDAWTWAGIVDRVAHLPSLVPRRWAGDSSWLSSKCTAAVRGLSTARSTKAVSISRNVVGPFAAAADKRRSASGLPHEWETSLAPVARWRLRARVACSSHGGRATIFDVLRKPVLSESSGFRPKPSDPSRFAWASAWVQRFASRWPRCAMLPLASGGNNGQVRCAIDKKDVYVIAAERVRRRQRQCSVPPSTEPAGGGAGEPSVRRHVLHSAGRHQRLQLVR